MLKLLVMDLPEGGHERAAPVVLVHLAVAEEVGALQYLADQLDALGVVRGQIVAVREMERVDIVMGSRVPLLHDVQTLQIGRGADCTTTFALGEKLLLGHFLCLRMVGDEDDVDLLVLGAEEPSHPEEKAAGDILLKAAHRPRRVHHRQDDGIGMRLADLLPRLEPKIVGGDAVDAGLAGVGVAAQVLDDRPLLVDVGHQALLADIVEHDIRRGQLVLLLLLEVRQLELLEQHRLQLLHRDLGFVIILAGLIAGAVSLAGLAVRRIAAEHVPDLAVAVSLADVLGFVVVIPEPVLVEAADRHLQNLLAVRHDDALLGDEIGEVLPQSVSNLLLVAALVLVPLAVQRPVLAGYDEQRFGHFGPSSAQTA